MSFPRISDLSTLAAAVSDQPAYRRLASSIRKALLAQSCGADLKQSEAVLHAADKLRKSARGYKSAERATTEGALLYTAVSLYARATWSSTKRGDRGSIGISDHLSAVQLDDHIALINIRNEAFAHVYKDREVAGDIWHSGLMVAVETGPGWLVGGASRSTTDHGPVWNILHRQVPVALSIVTKSVLAKIDLVSGILKNSDIPLDLLLDHLADPIVLFGSEEAAAAMMPGGAGIAHVKRKATT